MRWRSGEHALAFWRGSGSGLTRMRPRSGKDTAAVWLGCGGCLARMRERMSDHNVGRACEECRGRMSGNTELREQSAEGTEGARSLSREWSSVQICRFASQNGGTADFDTH
jgi:hypothetical protein